MTQTNHYSHCSDNTDVIMVDGLIMIRSDMSDNDLEMLNTKQENFGEIFFLLCFEGKLTFMCGTKKITLNRGEGFYNFHSETYRFISQHTAIVYICSSSVGFASGLIISTSIKTTIMKWLIRSPIFLLPSALRPECDHCFEMIKKETLYTRGLFHNESIRSLSAYLLYHTLNCISITDDIIQPIKEIESTPETHYNNFLLLLNENVRKERGLTFYSDRLSITPAYLSSVIKRFSGKTGHDFISDSLILEVKHLLKNTELSIKQISFELNFPNPSFFSKYFLHKTGMTPLEFRRSESKC